MIKRLFDITTATTALVVLSPVYAITAYKIKKNLGSPILFRQTRPGLGGKPFEMVKFRTMTDERDENGELLTDAIRLTDFGKFLRSTSLDELPELWNVFKGDMSIVGPRPLLMRYMPYYKEEELKRFDVRPGITGLAQVNGRNFLSWDERFKLDVDYVNKLSIKEDIRIIFLTLKKVIGRDDIADMSNITMLDLDQERFGNEG